MDIIWAETSDIPLKVLGVGGGAELLGQTCARHVIWASPAKRCVFKITPEDGSAGTGCGMRRIQPRADPRAPSSGTWEGGERMRRRQERSPEGDQRALGEPWGHGVR